ncbi:MAG TPA: copper resistance CopC family protein [Amycolatopsis sp.]|uniref:Copper resistance protein CopC n=1 Tax=Amycolatopsis nalaikhensis TaxID=715472 RepID=A0ABY8XIT3_9PSEU|nr:copper resistance CopC family protein [Amycolatopsis sp. 2-2]WIV55522.1 copper resistance protein CopC [Amycolatopsis sp. 2-2]
MIPRRAFGALLAALIGLVVLAGPASAHTELESSSPAEGASLAEAPTRIQLTFGEPVTLPPDPVKITGRDGTAWQTGAATVTDKVVTVPVTPSGPAQAYTLTWKAIAADGDNVTGTVHFTVTAAASSTAAPTTTAPGKPTVDTSAIPGWVWVLVAVAAVLAAGVALLRVLKGPKR